VRQRGLFLIAGLALFAAGCHTDMWVQPRLRPLEASDSLPNGSASQPPVPGTVARGQLREDDVFYKGRTADGKLVVKAPFEKAIKMIRAKSIEELVLRGRDRFDAFCSPCHGRLGDGKGMIAQRGFNLRRKPANYHSERLVKLPDGHFYDVMTNGFGVMFSYAARVAPEDRWAIVAYIRTLQFSQRAKAGDVPPPSETPKTSTEGASH
jgi:mono/diheme cytochrome c family protein